MKREVGIWIRVSTDEQAKGESPIVHRERALSYAAAKGWEVTQIYDLSGTSGKSVIHHEETQKMLADIASGRITGLIFSKLARLGRNTKELLELADIFQKHGADLISVEESIDTSTPAGRLLFTIMAAMAQAEREEIAARVASSVPIRAKMGKSLGGAAPFGYQWKDHALVPDPKEAPIRKLMFDLYLEIKTLRGVATELNNRGHRTRRGKKFTMGAVRRSLTDTTAKGVRIANYTKSRGEGKSWDLKPEEDWVRIPVEPIVSEEIWEQVNAMIAEGAKRYLRENTNKGRAKHLFSGFVYCGVCGGKQKLYPGTGDRNYTCLKCRGKIPKDDLEKLFLKKATSFLVDEEKVLGALEGQQSKWQEAEELAKTTRAKLQTVQKDIDQLLELYKAGAVSISEVKEQMKPLEEQKQQLARSLTDYEEQAKRQKVSTSKVVEVISTGQTLKDEWESYEFEKKRSIVEDMVERIVIEGKKVLFELIYFSSLKFLADPAHKGGFLQFAKGLHKHAHADFMVI